MSLQSGTKRPVKTIFHRQEKTSKKINTTNTVQKSLTLTKKETGTARVTVNTITCISPGTTTPVNTNKVLTMVTNQDTQQTTKIKLTSQGQAYGKCTLIKCTLLFHMTITLNLCISNWQSRSR